MTAHSPRRTLLLACLLLAATPALAADPAPVPVTFDRDLKFTHTHTFTKDDPADLGRRYREFILTMAKGDCVLIELRGANFEPAYLLFDADGRTLWRDDGAFHGTRELRFLRTAFQFPGTFRLRVMASEADTFGKLTVVVRGGMSPARGPDMLPVRHEPAAGGLTTAAYEMGDLSLRAVTLPGLDSNMGQMGLWDEAGKFLYCYNRRAARAYKVRFDEKRREFFKEDAEADLGGYVLRMGWSSEGLAFVVDTKDPTVVVVDPGTMKVLRRVKVGTQTNNAFTFATHAAQPFGIFLLPREILLIDLKKGEVAGRSPAVEDPDTKEPVRQLLYPVLTPDGKYCFASGYAGVNKLYRLKVEGKKVVLDSVLARPRRDLHGLHVSPDGKYLARSSGSGDTEEDSAELYAVDDLARPAFTLPRRYAPAAYDGAGRLYARAQKEQRLDVYPPPAGGKLGEPRRYLWSCGRRVFDLQPHPRGLGFLVMLEESVTVPQVYYVEHPSVRDQ
jgi:hypothetical protein